MEDPLNIRLKEIDGSSIPDLIRISLETGITQWTAQNFLDEIALPESILIRAISEEGETIGFVVGRTVPGDREGENNAEIYNIAVLEEFSRTGTGQALMDEFLIKAAQANVSSVWLEVRESNERAISFYKRNGFKDVTVRPNFYSDPIEAAICMKFLMNR
jgi:[ribosomal protein S18]-alanine N-acetyltransferase